MARASAGTTIGLIWILVAALGAFDVAREANASARGAVLGAWLIATALVIAAARTFTVAGTSRRAGLLLLLGGLVMPASPAWLKLVPIAYGGLVALRSRPRSRVQALISTP